MNDLSNLLWWQKRVAPEHLTEMENVLGAALEPVTPRPEFILNLRRGLMNYSFPEPETDKTEIARNALLVLAGAVGTVVLFSLGVRVVAAVVSALGLLQYSSRNLPRKRLTQPIRPAV